jgi:AcrR family transcriptional regulator
MLVDYEGLSRTGPSEGGRMAVLEAAATVFADRGFKAATIDDIAEELGSSKGRIYHYYRSKGDIFVDLLVYAMEDLLAQVQPIMNDASLDPTECIRLATRMHAKVMLQEGARSRVAIQGTETWLMTDAVEKQRAALKYFVSLRDEYEQYFADAIAEGIAGGLFRPVNPRLATKSVFGVLNWINLWYRPRKSDDVEALADEFASFCVGGLLVQGD